MHANSVILTADKVGHKRLFVNSLDVPSDTANCAGKARAQYMSLTGTQAQGCRDTLCLSRALSPLVHQIDPAFGDLGWVAKLCEPWEAPLDKVPGNVDLHEHAQIALAWQGVFESTQMPIVHCFVDGSTSKEGAGWAVVVVSETRDVEGRCAFALKGVLAGPVELAPQQEEWVGAEAASLKVILTLNASASYKYALCLTLVNNVSSHCSVKKSSRSALEQFISVICAPLLLVRRPSKVL